MKHKCEAKQWEGQIYQCKHCLRAMEKEAVSTIVNVRPLFMTDRELLQFRIGCLTIVLVAIILTTWVSFLVFG